MIKPIRTKLSALAIACAIPFTLTLNGCSSSGSGGSPSTQPPVEEVNERENYVNFESAAVRPVAISADKQTVYITNTPDNTLDIFRYNAEGQLQKSGSVSVGIDPVSVNLDSNGNAWVVNHLSDSVSIVKFDRAHPYVAQTLLTGDEPRDIVFARGKAFITTAHRGQHRSHSSIADVDGAGDPQLFTAAISRADIWVFDTANTGNQIGGKPLKIIELFGDTPRALAVTPDQSKVYVAVLHSGNQTTAVHEAVMCEGFEDDSFGDHPCTVMDGISSPEGMANGQLPGGRTAPGINKDGVYQPWTSMIVKYHEDSGEWRDSKGRNFSNGIRFHLPDKDVFAIDTTTLNQNAVYTKVGTTLFNMAVNPANGNLYITNTEANNATRFEGPGVTGGSTVQGNIARSRITVIDPDADTVRPRPLNRHIDYSQIKAPETVKPHTIALPTQIAVSGDGQTLYAAALGSDKVAVYPSTEFDDDSYWDNKGNEFDPTQYQQKHITVEGGPAGLLLNEARRQLLVYTRFDNSLVTINTENRQEIQRIALNNPEPASVVDGRAMLYDADRSSSNGEAACASCHTFGDGDQLSWNLGNPDASNGTNPQPFPTEKFSSLGCDFVGPEEGSCQLLQVLNGDGNIKTIASMKGPMFTQTLRGMSTHGHQHWRGDRAVGYFGTDTEQTLDEKTSFKNFIVAFEGLLGMDIDLPETVDASRKSSEVIQLEKDVDQFADFMLKTQMPPNPIRNLDNSLSASAQVGRNFFLGDRRSDGLAQDSDLNGPEQDGVNCEGCHGLDPAKGFYGTRGEIAHGGEIQILKVPQLRNLYTRVGMFGLPDRNGFLPSHTRSHQGDQIRGFGFLHDGATDLLFNFLKGGVFDNGETPCPPGMSSNHGCEFNLGFVGIPNDTVRQALVQYLMEFDTDIAPIVGQQITLNNTTGSAHLQRLQLLEQRAATPFVSKILGDTANECDLVAHGLINGIQKSYLFRTDTGNYIADTASESPLSKTAVRDLAATAGNSLTFTCQVPGAGIQMALDRDLDGTLNRDEVTL